MSEHDKEILAQLENLDTPALSDALDSLGINGGLLGITQQVQGTRCSGFAFTVQYEPVIDNIGFKNAANYIDQVPENSIIVSANNGRMDCTVWGDIMTHVATIKGIRGTVIDGVARDFDTLSQLHYPLFSRGRFMQSAKNRTQMQAVQVPLQISGVTVNPGDAIVCDSNGCLVIPYDKLSEVIRRAAAVEKTERGIIDSVNAGLPLIDARLKHRYDQPWLSSDEKADVPEQFHKGRHHE
ncbi:RraA family protein [Agrobacterium tumefaciens]|uniref:RraA family protein n=1 Tax=Agrobacterium tumefaciens TaxID=358 RepID=UPI0021CF98F1|nr:RraA family protein [Agrobacterium tumefaciens]UXS01904.1 RraA family protein [Agrobacterium tumefaciens]